MGPVLVDIDALMSETVTMQAIRRCGYCAAKRGGRTPSGSLAVPPKQIARLHSAVRS